MSDNDGFTFVAADADSDKRLDSFIAEKIPHCSRKLAASLIRNGSIRVSGSAKKPGYRIRPGEVIQGAIPKSEPVSFQPEPVQIDILFEDSHLIVLNKAPGIVVHPAPGNYTGTLVNGLLYHCPGIEGIGGEIRPGIVHRLDKDTSGVLLVAKNHIAHAEMSHQFQSRTVEKKYLALVYGHLKQKNGTIHLPIGRHPTQRKKMSTISKKPREALTAWRVKEQYHGLSLLEITLYTGRTHQIRVHCHAIHHPVVGDPVYGIRNAGRRISQLKENGDRVMAISRQMLHSRQLTIHHPVTREKMVFEAPIPKDMHSLLAELR
ncbi:MAG: RluA family pseudouridine synthase [Desulfobacteraceae bacterium]|nr:MAG: RluA family pseudouridine synthase [Desulfobacteraceae bacterium]